MSHKAAIYGEGFSVMVSDDRMAASVAVDAEVEVKPQAVFAALREVKIVGFDEKAITEALGNRNGMAVTIPAASGQPAVDERPAKLLFKVPVPGRGAAFLVARVDAGQLIAAIQPVIAGTDGKDVFGAVVPPAKGPPLPTPGRGLEVTKAGIVSTAKGSLHVSDARLSVDPIMDVDADTDAPPAVQFDGDVVIKGGANEGRVIEATGMVSVGGGVEAAIIRAGDAVHVKGGIIGRIKGKVIAGGDVDCRFANLAWVETGGDFTAQSEVARSHIAACGRVTITAGAAVAGEIHGKGGVTARTLGSANGVATVVSAGVDETRRRAIAELLVEIRKNTGRSQKIRKLITPLMANPKATTPQQREKATELLYEASELEAATEGLMRTVRELHAAASAGTTPEVVVAETIYPGVVIKFPGMEVQVRQKMAGPVKFSLMRDGGKTEIVCRDETTGAMRAIETAPIRDNLLPVLPPPTKAVAPGGAAVAAAA